MDDSLVRVTRRVADDHYASILAEREPRSPREYRTAGYNTPPEGGHVPTVLILPREPMLA